MSGSRFAGSVCGLGRRWSHPVIEVDYVVRVRTLMPIEVADDFELHLQSRADVAVCDAQDSL